MYCNMQSNNWVVPQSRGTDQIALHYQTRNAGAAMLLLRFTIRLAMLVLHMLLLFFTIRRTKCWCCICCYCASLSDTPNAGAAYVVIAGNPNTTDDTSSENRFGSVLHLAPTPQSQTSFDNGCTHCPNSSTCELTHIGNGYNVLIFLTDIN